jgi:hypothetical protein
METGWVVLLVGTVVMFIVGAAVQIGVFVGLGLCMDEDPALCDPGTVPTSWEMALATVPTYLLWVAPSVAAAVIAYRALHAGVSRARPLLITSCVLAVLITAAATAMWWL